MWKWAGLGAALMAAGALKFQAHLAEAGRQVTLQDYLAMRCSEGAAANLAAASHGVMAQAFLHCWGCYAMAAGAAVLAVSLWRRAVPGLADLRCRR